MRRSTLLIAGVALVAACGGDATETTVAATAPPAGVEPLAVGPDRVVAMYEGQAAYVAAALLDPQADKSDLYRVHVIEPYWPFCFTELEVDGYTPEDYSARFALRDIDRLGASVAALQDDGLASSAGDAVVNARTILDGPPLTLCLQAAYPTTGPFAVLDDVGGVVSWAGAETILFGVDPEQPDWRHRTRYAVAREYCAHIEMQAGGEPDASATLLDWMVLMGKAHTFASIAEPGPVSPQIMALTPEQEASLWEQRVGFQLDSEDMGLIRQFMFAEPGPGVPLWAGHTIGYHIVQAYLVGHPDTDIAAWFAVDPVTMLAESGYDGAFVG